MQTAISTPSSNGANDALAGVPAPTILSAKNALGATKDALDSLNSAIAASQKNAGKNVAPPVPPAPPANGTSNAGIDPNTGLPHIGYDYGQKGTGRYNAQGQTIDANGNPVDANGNPIDTTVGVARTQTTGGKSTTPSTTVTGTGNPAIDKQLQTYQDKANEYDNEAATIRKQMADIASGVYMSPTTQTVLQSVISTYDDAYSKQAQANAATIAGWSQSAFRRGLTRYAPDIYSGELHSVMQSGIDKLSTIANNKAAAIAKAQSAAQSNDFNNLYKEMTNYQTLSKNETTAATDLLKQVQDAAKQDAENQKAQQQAQASQEKTMQKKADDAAYIVLQYLNESGGTNLEDDKKAVQDFASANGLDPTELLGAVEALRQKQQKYGSGVIGQYQFYADQERAAGRTPMSFAGYQAWQKNVGKKTAPGNAAGNQLTKSDYAKLEQNGIDQATADAITGAILQGEPLDQIRQDMRDNNLDPAILDTYDRTIGIAKIQKNEKPKATAAGSTQVIPPGTK